MKILSTGEKIKRSRIYKGITLKELCEDKISISKMSCIENGKIDADRKTLEFIADKLDLKLEYLIEDVRVQIEKNIDNIENFKGEEYEYELKSNFDYSLKYGYVDLAVKSIRKLFKYYLDKDKYGHVEKIIPMYYNLYQKNTFIEDIYYRDMAMYFFRTGEYLEAITYFNNIGEKIGEANKNAEYFLAESLCYSSNKQYSKAFECINRAIEKLDEQSDDEKINIQIYVEQLILKLKLNGVLDEELLKTVCEAIEKYKSLHVDLYLRVAESFGEAGKVEEFMFYIEQAKSVVEVKRNSKYVEFLNRCISDLMAYDKLDEAGIMVEESLNLSILLDSIELIDKGYYLKAKLYQKLDNMNQAEIYMNLSMDALAKYSGPEQIHDRYLEMGNMYYKLNDLRESLKYFTLAKNMEKNI